MPIHRLLPVLRTGALSALLLGTAALARRRGVAAAPAAAPGLDRLVLRPESRAADVAFLASGFRRLAADAAWVDLLLYTGGEGVPREGEAYAELLPRTLRVVRLDPRFTRAYVFSAGILAWFNGVERPQEALALLEEGIRANPDHGPLRAYAAAILYKTQDRPREMIALLEQAVRDPDCPIVVKTILANLHKSRGDYAKAAVVWEAVLADPAASSEHARARAQLRALRSPAR